MADNDLTIRSQFLRWTLLSCLGFPLVVSITFQIKKAVIIASRGIDGETVARKFFIGFAVDFSTLVCLTAVLSAPVILAMLQLPSRFDWMKAQENRIWIFLLGIGVWQLPVSSLASYLLEGPSFVMIATIGVVSLIAPPLLFRSVRPTYAG